MQEDVEKLHETKKRVSDFLSELEEVYTGNSSTLLHSHDIIVVSHSQLLKTLIEHIEQKPLHEIQDFYIPQLKRHKIHNASVTIYDYVS
jgi:broad specificity phosphatase PhoE